MQGKIYATGHNYIFQEVSALTGDGIQELFLNKLLSQIRTQLLYKGKIVVDQEEEQLKFNLQGNKDKKKKNKQTALMIPDLIERNGLAGKMVDLRLNGLKATNESEVFAMAEKSKI